MKNLIGERLSPVLEEIEITLWQNEVHDQTKPNYTFGGFRAALKIFMSALLDKIWEMQEDENIDFKDRLQMGYQAGEEIRKIIHVYTGLDPTKFYPDSKSEIKVNKVL